MAAIQAKSAVRKKQLAVGNLQLAKARQNPKPQTRSSLTQRAQRNLKTMEAPARVVRFPQAKGRVVEEVEFYSGSDYNCFSLKFQDKTNLCFEIESGFTLLADFSRWKSGEQQILRDWPPLGNR